MRDRIVSGGTSTTIGVRLDSGTRAYANETSPALPRRKRVSRCPSDWVRLTANAMRICQHIDPIRRSRRDLQSRVRTSTQHTLRR